MNSSFTQFRCDPLSSALTLLCIFYSRHIDRRVRICCSTYARIQLLQVSFDTLLKLYESYTHRYYLLSTIPSSLQSFLPIKFYYKRLALYLLRLVDTEWPSSQCSTDWTGHCASQQSHDVVWEDY